MSRNVLWTKRNTSLDETPDVASAFAPVRVLGEGAFGVVLLVRKVGEAGRDSLHAMKIMDKKSVDARVLAAERAVLEAVCGIDSPFLVKLQRAAASERRARARARPRERPARAYAVGRRSSRRSGSLW